jgi:hypothetical protein
VQNGSTFWRHGSPVGVASKPSMFTRGMTVTVTASRISFAPSALLVRARTSSTAELLTVNSSPCWLATITIPRSPLPIVTIGIARPLPLAWKGEYVSSAAPWLRLTNRSSVETSSS